jgi:hypothetical protein
VKILFNYLDHTQQCNSRLDLFESQLRASTSAGSNTDDAARGGSSCVALLLGAEKIVCVVTSVQFPTPAM